MALPSVALPYGMREIKLTPYTTDAATALGTGVLLPASQKMSFSESESFTELRGDDIVYASRGSGPKISWDLESGGISLAAYKILVGGTNVASGTTPAEKNTYTKLATDGRPYFKAEGRAISDNGGDFHVILYKCKCTGSIEGEMADGTFALTSASGEAFSSTLTSHVGKLYEFVHNETAIAIT